MNQAYSNGLSLKLVISKLEEKIPLNYACDWDNVGLLVEPSNDFVVQSILLTNDLTESVLNEALALNSNLIISYHPPLFRPLKKLTQKTWKERIVAKCLQHGIAVYSPHTALDAIEGGINDWLLQPFECCEKGPVEKCVTDLDHFGLNSTEYILNLSTKNFTAIKELKQNLPKIQLTNLANEEFLVKCGKDDLSWVLNFINQNQMKLLSVTNNFQKLPLLNEGMGRIGQLSKPLSIESIINTVKKHLGLEKLRLALSVFHDKNSLIKSIAVCAGSGFSVLQNVQADILISGEMSHHEILDFVHKGISVILCEHSNTERGYLNDSLKKYLSDNLNVKIIVSSKDRDPITII